MAASFVAIEAAAHNRPPSVDMLLAAARAAVQAVDAPSGKSPLGLSSLPSAVSTAVPERSRLGTPRQDKDGSASERRDFDSDLGAGTFTYGYLREHGLKSSGHDRVYQKYRSRSVPASVSVPMQGLSLPAMPAWEQIATATSPLTLGFTPAPVSAPYPVASREQCTTLWTPPPLPPVPCELSLRLEALEQKRRAFHHPDLERAWIEQAKLEQTIEVLRKQLAQKHEEEDWKQRVERQAVAQRSTTFEADGLRRDLQVTRTLYEKEQRARDELGRVHSEVVAGNARLQAEIQKLQADFDAERLAKQEVLVRHEAVEADALSLKLDLDRLRSAHNLELHSTRSDFHSQHQVVEELTKKLQADLQQMELDLSRETQARLEVQKKFDAAFADAEKLREDVLHVQAARDAEQLAREDIELKHRSAEAGNEQLRQDLRQLQVLEELTKKLQTDLQHVEIDRDQLITNLQQSETQCRELELTVRDNLGAAKVKLEEVEADRDQRLAEALQKVRDVEDECERLRSDIVHVTRAKEQREESEANLRYGIEDERGTVRNLRAQVDSLEKYYEVKTRELQDSLEIKAREHSDALQKVRDVEDERERLRSDMLHLKRAKEQREESEVNLRHGIEDERGTIRHLRAQLETLEKEYEVKTRELQESLEIKAREHSDLFVKTRELQESLEVKAREHSDMFQKRGESELSLRKDLEEQRITVRKLASRLETKERECSQVEADRDQRLAEVQQKVRDVEDERDRLRSDMLHLKRAKEQREESEVSLRHGIEDERGTVRTLRAQLETLEKDYEVKTRELQESLEVKMREHSDMRQNQSTSELRLRKELEEQRISVRELSSRLEIKEREYSASLQLQRSIGSDVEDVQQRLRDVEAERDRLKSDMLHLKRAKEQREESEASLRRGIEEERKAVRELRHQLESSEQELKRVKGTSYSADTQHSASGQNRTLTAPAESRVSLKDLTLLNTGSQPGSQMVMDLTGVSNTPESEASYRETREGAMMEVDLTEDIGGPSLVMRDWNKHQDDLGRTYYHNTITDETHWEESMETLITTRTLLSSTGRP